MSASCFILVVLLLFHDLSYFSPPVGSQGCELDLSTVPRADVFLVFSRWKYNCYVPLSLLHYYLIEAKQNVHHRTYQYVETTTYLLNQIPII